MGLSLASVCYLAWVNGTLTTCSASSAGDFRVVPGLGDHGAAVRVSDEQEPAVHSRDRSLHRSDVVRP